MEKLSQEQQESLRKATNERLRVMAARIGSVSDEEIAAMDRSALLQVVVAGSTTRAEGEKDITPSATARKPPGEVVVQLELRQAQLELRKAEIDAEHKKAERESRKAELEAEREFRMRLMEMEEKEKERQDRKDRMEFDSRVKELEMG